MLQLQYNVPNKYIVDDSSFELVIVEAETLEGLIVIFLHIYWLPTIFLRVGL